MTEHNIFQEIQDDLERQKLEALWKRYGILVIAAALAIVGATAGITAWHSWQDDKNQQATAGLLLAVQSAGDDDLKKIDALKDFSEKNKDTTQSAIAQLDAASLAVKNGHPEQAVQIYDAVAKTAKLDPAFRQLADLMSVRTQLDSGAIADLQNRLEPLMADKAPWRFTAMEYAGYVALRAGDKAKAIKIFTNLSQNAATPQSLGARAADMLRYVSQ